MEIFKRHSFMSRKHGLSGRLLSHNIGSGAASKEAGAFFIQ